MCCGDSAEAAISLVARSTATTTIRVPQKRGGLGLALSIFFALLALDTVSGVRQCVEALEAYLSPAVVALPEVLRVPIEAGQRFVDVPEESAYLAHKQKRFSALHRIGALIRHVKGVCAQVAVRTLRGRPESLVVMPQLLQDALALFEQSLLKMLKVFLRHRLRLGGRRLFAASCWCHF